MVEMTVAGLAIDASNRNPIILLRDTTGSRQVPIWVDHGQAHNIMAGIQANDSSQPLSHDLMMALIMAGGLNLEKVIIHSIEENNFRAVLKITLQKKEQDHSLTGERSDLEINARPSDAIALAVRAPCSIWMLEEVVSEASIPVDTEADQEDQNEFHRFIEDVSPASLIQHLKERQSSGEDFQSFEDKGNDLT